MKIIINIDENVSETEITISCNQLTEEIENIMATFLHMCNVNAFEYLLGNAIYIVLICMLGSLVIAFAGGYVGYELLTFMLIMFTGHSISMLLGATIGVFGKNQIMATSLTVPVMMIFSFLPMLSMFNESIKKIAKFFYSEQLYLLINDLNSIEISMETIVILSINICLILSCFILAYQKVFMKQY